MSSCAMSLESLPVAIFFRNQRTRIALGKLFGRSDWHTGQSPSSEALCSPNDLQLVMMRTLFFFAKSLMAANTSSLSIREPNPLVGMSMLESCAKLLLQTLRSGEPRDHKTLVNGDPIVSAQRFLAWRQGLRSRHRFGVRDNVSTR
jgi:hypothetical protein